MSGGTLGPALAGIGLAGATLAGLAGIASIVTPHTAVVVALSSAAIGAAGIWLAASDTWHRRRETARLAETLATVDPERPRLPERWTGEEGRDGGLDHVAQSLAHLFAEQRERSERQAGRLESIVGTLDRALVAVTDSGLVSLRNAGAATLLGKGHAKVGTSVFDAVERSSYLKILDEAVATGRSDISSLRLVDGAEIAARVIPMKGDGGSVIMFVASPTEKLTGLEHDLALHDRPPPPPPLSDETPLDQLPFLILDVETTGLDAFQDRIVSLAAIVGSGTRTYPALTVDSLVDPGVPIPTDSTRVHGISNAMVEGAPSFAEAIDEIVPYLGSRVVVGHSIGFDMAVIRTEAKRAGLALPKVTMLDTAQLAAVIETAIEDVNMETLARLYGVEIRGRHTALGDCIVTAELWSHIARRMKRRGVTTLGEARTLAKGAKRLAAAQAALGWGDDE